MKWTYPPFLSIYVHKMLNKRVKLSYIQAPAQLVINLSKLICKLSHLSDSPLIASRILNGIKSCKIDAITPIQYILTTRNSQNVTNFYVIYSY